MTKQATHAVTIIIVLLAIASLATGPATKPSNPKTPAKKRADADSTIYKCETLGFSFSAPKAWTALQNNPSVGRFELNMNASQKPEKAGAKKSAPTHSNFEVNGGTPCHGDATLDGQAKAVTEGLLKDPKAKLVSDESTTLAGERARAFVIESTDELTRTENGKEVKIPVKMREHYVLAVRNGKGYKIWLWCDAASYEKQVKLFTRTLATFEWLDK